MASVDGVRSLLPLAILLDVSQVSDDVGAAVFVDDYQASCLHLLHPADCVLSVCDLLLPSVELLLQLLDLAVLLLDFGGQTLAVERGGLL